ncbi:MAG: TlpA family protein disulfide reductase [Planctomycetes bacterium]|nr:TlpA family protein disulfide reductase [Planctomycetota bacterium]
MRKTMTALILLAGLTVSTAAAQTIHLRITQREDGGETVSLGQPSPPAAAPAQPQPQPGPADGRAIVVQTAAAVAGEIAHRGVLSPDVARRAMESLTGDGIAPHRLDEASQVLFYRTVAYAAALAGDAGLAARAAEQWARLRVADPSALRARIMASMLNRDRAAAVGAVARLASPAHKAWEAWARYMTPLAALTAERPELRLTAADGRSVRLADLRGQVVVLYFWTAASGGDGAVDEALAAQRRLAEPTGGPVAVLGINLDEKADRDARGVVAAVRGGAGDLPQVIRGTSPDGSAERAMDLFGITAVPTGVVLAMDGSVIFAGDPRTWEIHTAIDYARSVDPQRVQAAAPAPPQAPEALAEPTAAREREALQLRDQGWDLVRLGLKTGSAAYKRQGRDILERVVRDYPGTEGARKAQRDLIEADR